MKIYHIPKYMLNKYASIIIVTSLTIICICCSCASQKSNDNCIPLNDIEIYYSDIDFSKRNGLFLSSGQLLQKDNSHLLLSPDSISHNIDLSLMFQSEQLRGKKIIVEYDLFSEKETDVSILFEQYSNSSKTIDDVFFSNYINNNSIKVNFLHNDSTLAYVFNFKITSDDVVSLKNINIQIDNTRISKIFAYDNSKCENKRLSPFLKIKLSEFNNNVADKLYLICKIWGFLKYYHPAVNQGFYNWDEELFSVINKMINIKDHRSFQDALWKWINSLDFNILPHYDVINTNLQLYKKDFSWINSSQLEEKVSLKLLQILSMNRDFKYNYYINPRLSESSFFERESKYEDMEYSDTFTRLLSFFRFWNFIEYCYPYRSLIEDWDKCFVTYLPKFVNSKNKSDFLKQLTSLCAKIKDSHISVISKDTPPPYGIKQYRLYIDVKSTVDNNYLVYKSWHPEIKTGDLIMKINDVPIRELVDSLALYTSASNQRSLLNKLSSVIFSSDVSEIRIDILRNNEFITKSINLNTNQYCIIDYIQTNVEKLLSQGILYIKSSNKVESIEEYIPDSLESIKGVILDLRSYPSKDMFDYIISKFAFACSNFAWCFYNTSLSPGFYSLIYKNNICDYVHNKNLDFSGKIVVIVDENTVSHGEFLCMALQCIPNCTVIGSQTAGAIGNVSLLQLPDNISVAYTKIATCYPDLTPVQQVGIKIDYKLELDINSLIKHEDNFINFAIKIINNE